METKGPLTLPIWLALCFAQFLIAETTRSDSPQIQVALGDVKDVRPNGKEPGKLEMTLKISGGEFPSDAKGCRIAVTKAIDDTGLDLLVPEDTATEFRPAVVNSKFVVKLKNPERKAGHVQEISGNVEVFVPQNDPPASVTQASFRKNTGKPIKSDVLKSAGVEVTAWTTEQYNALIKKREADELKDSEAREREAIKAVEARGQQLNGVDRDKEIARIKASFARQRETVTFGRQMGFSSAAKSNDIAFSIDDDAKKVVGTEFRDAMDKPIQSAGFSESYRQHGSQIERTRTYHFESPLPANAKLLIFVATPQSLTRTPFTLTDVTLP